MADLCPVFETNLEDFAVVDCRDFDEIEMSVDEKFLVLGILDKAEMIL
jgi:hypothetical protein